MWVNRPGSTRHFRSGRGLPTAIRHNLFICLYGCTQNLTSKIRDHSLILQQSKVRKRIGASNQLEVGGGRDSSDERCEAKPGKHGNDPERLCLPHHFQCNDGVCLSVSGPTYSVDLWRPAPIIDGHLRRTSGWLCRPCRLRQIKSSGRRVHLSRWRTCAPQTSWSVVVTGVPEHPAVSSQCFGRVNLRPDLLRSEFTSIKGIVAKGL